MERGGREREGGKNEQTNNIIKTIPERVQTLYLLDTLYQLS